VPRGFAWHWRRGWQCREQIRSDRFLVINGDDLFGAADLANSRHVGWRDRARGAEPKNSASCPEPMARWKSCWKTRPPPPQLANTGAYLFPREVFELEIGLSPLGEYEITDYRQPARGETGVPCRAFDVLVSERPPKRLERGSKENGSCRKCWTAR